MSNNLVSQHLSMESNQVGQLVYMPSKMDTTTEVGLLRPGVDHSAGQHMPLQNLQMGMVGAGLSGMAVTQGGSLYQASYLGAVTGSTDMVSQIPVSNYQVNRLGSVVGNPVSHNPIRSSVQMMQMNTLLHHKVQEQQTPFHEGPREIGSMHQLQQPSMLTKRKLPMETVSADAASQKLSIPNKRMLYVEHPIWLPPPQLKIPSQTRSPRNSTGSPRTPALATSKRSQSVPGLQQNQAAAPKRSVPSKAGQMAASPMAKNESFDPLRSKMRESLASALALVVENKSSSPGSTDEKSSQNELPQEKSQSTGQNSAEINEVLNVREGTSIRKSGDCQTDFHCTLKNDGNDLRPTVTLCDADISFSDSFFVKDDLLQGNGLSWALEPDIGLTEKKNVESEPMQPLAHQEDACEGNRARQVIESPENLASKIEAGLFKLFGGVNKKYKEKGRSLLFNLKDRNNPELRERVMSGEILPEQLCSMTAEELASKELSQWRIAKAEELAQMVVLPDTEVDIRRLVRKTHKGEFQVEIEEPGSINLGAVGTSVPEAEPVEADKKNKSKQQEASGTPEVDSSKEKTKVTEAKSSAAGGKTNSVKQDASYMVTIPSNEATDLMQGLMVDDELKDAEFLPPILSLDEFMESLDSEPPFEDLPKEAEGSVSCGDNLDTRSEAKSPDVPPEAPVDATSDKPDDVGMTKVKPDVDGKPLAVGSPVKSTAALLKELKGKRFWDGELQLNISTLAPVIGIFKSGEKTSAKEWPSLIEVKGRVRLDAFGKFLQELPMSRSRAIMAVYFICKDGASESDRANLREVADSYVSDERVGFAEPVSGVELYVCPPHGKTREMLGKVLPKDQIDSLVSLDCGLIGVVVWRKVTTVSPKSTTPHHKHNSKRQHVTSRRHQEKDTNVSLMSEHPSSARGGPAFTPKSQSEEDDDDELPPGFGPPGSRDEDDLPEFNFSSGPATSMPPYIGQNPAPRNRKPFHDRNTRSSSRPVDSIRELIHKYGQSEDKKPQVNYPERRGLGVAVQPWNDDEDDDMPEWHPDQPPLQPHQPQLLRPQMGQQMLPPGGQLYGTSRPGYGAAHQGGATHRNRGGGR